MTDALLLESVSKAYGDTPAVCDLDLSMRQGEILGFYGLVGAGRSEVMQALFGTTRPTKGVVKVDGRTAVIRSPADAIARDEAPARVPNEMHRYR